MYKSPLILRLLLLVFLVSVNTLSFGQARSLEVKYKKNTDNSYDFTYRKSEYGSHTIVIKFENLTNARYTGLSHVVKANSGLLFKLTPIDASKGISFSWKYRSYKTAVVKKLDKDFVYLLPFPENAKVKCRNVSNVNEKYFNAEISDSWQAYAFYSETDSVMSVRKGIVVKVIDDFQTDPNVHYTSKMNQVIVEHNDRTRASYKGFAIGKIAVKPGDIVYPNSFLGERMESDAKNEVPLFLMVYYTTELDLSFKTKLPYFLLSDDVRQIEFEEEYIAKSNLEIIQTEMSKREKKKMKKGEL